MLYPYPGYCGHGRTELPEVSGYRCERRTELPEVPGMGMNAQKNSGEFFVGLHPG